MVKSLQVVTVVLVAAVLVATGPGVGAAESAALEAGQHKAGFEVGGGTMWYWVHLPRGFQKAGKLPLILFLHGSGERGPADGSQLDKVKVHGPPKIVEKNPDFAFIVVSPQCHANEHWDAKQVLALLDHVIKNYPVDPDRVYLTGLSMGGFGTWATAEAAPDRFAAIVPICGGGDPKQACKLKDMPAWVFHGDADPAVPVARAKAMVEAIKKCDENAPIELTIYPGVGHDSWTRTYDNPKLYEWMLSHKRRETK
jgi:predicted peptidase